ncbi:NUDIX domain-containing protein [Chelativorans sp.]|uniref:NUDIX hydrolase n=1 Tax=Chelativorans sp. TaxID=2203393 RepID=UPI002811CBA8|nr:NUDIX domain-containing protein [Chelativorans sp.]
MDDFNRAVADERAARGATLKGKALRPRDAATLIVLDRRAGETSLLMGRRHRGHAFMPGRFVFPGGRTDPADSRIRISSGLHPAEEERLAGRGPRSSAARARAIALSAIRETYEEAGLLIGRRAAFASRSPHWQGFVAHGIEPALGGLRYIARAITPPGAVRRFDTRFLALWRSDVALELAESPTAELEEIVWLPVRDAMKLEIPPITKRVLEELEQRLTADPDLSPGRPVPFYFMRAKQMVRLLL